MATASQVAIRTPLPASTTKILFCEKRAAQWAAFFYCVLTRATQLCNNSLDRSNSPPVLPFQVCFAVALWHWCPNRVPAQLTMNGKVLTCI
jgi:hypothetical protein